jgi:hypothetical protein
MIDREHVDTKFNLSILEELLEEMANFIQGKNFRLLKKAGCRTIRQKNYTVVSSVIPLIMDGCHISCDQFYYSFESIDIARTRGL